MPSHTSSSFAETFETGFLRFFQLVSFNLAQKTQDEMSGEDGGIAQRLSSGRLTQHPWVHTSTLRDKDFQVKLRIINGT